MSASPQPAAVPVPAAGASGDAPSSLAAQQRQLAGAGALLFAVGIFTGLWAAAALTGQVKVGIPHLALAAHLNGLLGGLWMVCVAWTLPFLRFGEVGRRRLALGVGLPSWANWAVTVGASLLGVDGLQYTHEMSNNAIAALLQSLVVLPALVSSAAWAWGFFRKS
jgi:hypothetical protein